MFITPHDHTTLAFLAEEQAAPSGKKHYNPVPKSRIPSLPRAQRRAIAQVKHKPSRSDHALWFKHPVYAIRVLAGQEHHVARALLQLSRVADVMLPQTPSGQAMFPGEVFAAIPDAVILEIKRLLYDYQWGSIQKGTVDAETLESLLPYAGPILGDATPWLRHHPIRVMAEWWLHSRGLHGHLGPTGWTLKNAQHHPVIDPDFITWWRGMTKAFARRQPLSAIVQEHADRLLGVTFPITLTDTLNGLWHGQWMGLDAIIPAECHTKIRLRRDEEERTVYGMLTSLNPTPTFQLTHPDVVTHQLAYRLPEYTIAREPGEWAVVHVPFASDVVKEHVRNVNRQLGWIERWDTVEAHDARTIVRKLLQPRDVRFDVAQHRVVLTGVPQARLEWLTTAQEWLPEWDFEVE